MYPLISSDRDLTPAAVLDTYKRRSGIEQRFHHTKSVLEIAPALLKNPGRIHSLFIINFLALLVSALIERELRHAMQKHGIPDLPLYPEERTTRRPTAEQILKLFSTLQHGIITHHGEPIHTYQATLTPQQTHVLDLLGIPHHRYTNP
jgi:transposase